MDSISGLPEYGVMLSVIMAQGRSKALCLAFSPRAAGLATGDCGGKAGTDKRDGQAGRASGAGKRGRYGLGDHGFSFA